MRAAYERDGWILVRDLLDPALLADVFETVAGLLAFHDGLGPAAGGWQDPDFQRRMQALRTNAPVMFGLLYDAVSVSSALATLTATPALVRTAATLLGDRPAGLASTGSMVRMDAPSDTRNRLEWHQEASYYTQNERGENGIVLWFPLHEHRIEHGPVEVSTGSHIEGLIPVGLVNPGNLASDQYEVPAERVSRYPSTAVVAGPGDVLFFHMHLFHRSGVNISEEIRFSAGVRFHRMTTGDFTPGRLQYVRSGGASR